MWAQVEPYLPDRSPQPGGRWADHRDVIEAIAWKYRTGSPWRDLDWLVTAVNSTVIR